MPRTSLILGCVASLGFAAAASAQPPGITPEMIATALPLEGAPKAVPGPYDVVSEPAFGSPGHVVFRPADLDAFPEQDTLPVMAWGNGGCAINSRRYSGYLTTIASHGFLVIATAAEEGAERRRATDDDLRAALDWAEAENARDGSPLEGKIATDRMAVMGQSCGGFLAISLGADPRVDTIGVFNSGVQAARPDAPPSAFPTADALPALHGPVLLVNGHERDFMMEASAATFDAIDHVPAFYGARHNAGHTATVDHPGGGEFANVASSWLRYTLKGDAEAAAMFVGENCELCTNPNWDTRSKGLSAPTAATAPAKGTLERITVHGASLEGNLEGDDPNREVFVYLPPSYASSPARRYPVVYFLHGYGVGAERYVDLLGWPESLDAAIADGAREMIVVLPDAYTRYNGSMYSSSPTTGDWESFVTKDLVAYVDEHYRTVASPGSRGLSGHSMGGYGTMRIGMKHPGVFGALYAMSSCCLMNRAPSEEAVQAQLERTADGTPSSGGGFGNVLLAQAAAWAPNPQNPPLYLDWPYVDGEPQPIVQAKWAANSPLVLVDQYVTSLNGYRAIALDVGNEDRLSESNEQLDEALTRLGIEHTFEIYEGNHGNRVAQRFRENVLPFFARYLD
ncbi:MAG TPA: alpha/beta hydrolase-fold protein [Gammaproteobacteria bacterium]